MPCPSGAETSLGPRLRGMQALAAGGGVVVTERPAAPVEFSSSSPAPLRSARCLTCPSHPEGNTQGLISRRTPDEKCGPRSAGPPTSSLAAFLLGDFCLDSERDFPRDLSFSFSFSRSLSRFPSRSLPFFSLSESGDAWWSESPSAQPKGAAPRHAAQAHLPTCAASSWSSSCASWTFCSFSLEVAARVRNVHVQAQTCEPSCGGHSPDSPLEERSEGDLDWDLFFFL